ncbi:MAG: 30S ribosomal protein S17 [Deltaproteobacteria bacterium RBG_19FT_COMBO_46_9]|jgi:small subunit ribosomal protein S17|nr:MAG: 30S ribosomal protein S17 [Deltaproteobacteria bacterium RBG_19FT_COMBO_46_9]
MNKRGVRKKLIGIVIRIGMEKTAVVLVNRLKRHKTYTKLTRQYSRYMVHDPQNRCEVGDKVKIIESRPISKRKRWQLIEILEKGVKKDLDSGIDQILEQIP